jgi:hypothetical protein
MQYVIHISLSADDLTRLGEISLQTDGFNLNETIQRLICEEWSRLIQLQSENKHAQASLPAEAIHASAAQLKHDS